MSTDTKSFVIEINAKLITIEVTAHAYYDSYYRADADGNRSVPTWFLEGFDYKIPNTDDNDGVLSEIEKGKVETILKREAHQYGWQFDL